MKKKLKLPQFKNENEERRFWSKINLADYFKKEDFKPAVFPNLKPTSRAISILLPEYLFVQLKKQAHQRKVSYHTLLTQHIVKGVLTR